MKKNVAIIGAGNLGKALEKILSPRHTVMLWDKVPAKVPHQKSLAETVTDADIVFLAIPSAAVREAASSIAAFLKPHAVVASASKGIEAGTLATMDAVLSASLKPGQPHVFLGGPMLAKEIEDGKRAMAACGTANNRKHFAPIRQVFNKTNLKVEYSGDIRGVALCGVLKNVYTLGLGMAAGLQLGNNTIGWLASRGFAEISTIMLMLGGRKKTFMGTAGLGDFVATATSPHSMNYKAGSEIAQTGSTVFASEGIISLPSLLALLGSSAHKFPLLTTISGIVLHHHNAHKALTEFIDNAR